MHSTYCPCCRLWHLLCLVALPLQTLMRAIRAQIVLYDSIGQWGRRRTCAAGPSKRELVCTHATFWTAWSCAAVTLNNREARATSSQVHDICVTAIIFSPCAGRVVPNSTHGCSKKEALLFRLLSRLILPNSRE